MKTGDYSLYTRPTGYIALVRSTYLFVFVIILWSFSRMLRIKQGSVVWTLGVQEISGLRTRDSETQGQIQGLLQMVAREL